MYRILTGGLLIMTTILFLGGIFYNDHAAMWLASPDPIFGIVRLLIIICLLGLLFSAPPRSHAIRLFFATMSGLLFGIVFVELISGTNNILDILVFAQIAVVLKLEAIEYQPNIAIPYSARQRRTA